MHGALGKLTADDQRLFSYIIVSDTGFSPNPFHGRLTLACCKPRIRAQARPGDLVVGLSPRSKRIVHAFEVTETLTFAEYWADRRFRAKRPKWSSRRILDRCGDNIYESDGGGGYLQHPSQHYDNENDRERPGIKQRDLSADSVLVSERFTYFVGEGPALPRALAFLNAGRGHRSRFTPREIEKVRAWLESQERGVLGRPTISSEDDATWSTAGSGARGCVARASSRAAEEPRPARRSRTSATCSVTRPPAPAAPQRLILSRKGFDSSTVRVPSPILPDRSLVSLPIPERASTTTFADVRAGERSIGELVQQLTKGRIEPHFGTHLDPDLDAAARPRARGWRPAFGQANAAATVLEREGVGMGDLFLFFGWFRETEEGPSGLRYVRGAPDLHVLFGWLQIGRVLRPSEGKVPTWATEHPHVARPERVNNVLYVAGEELVIGGEATGVPGGGVFSRYREELRLTAEGESRSVWDLPGWFAPRDGRRPLGMHQREDRWERRGKRRGKRVRLRTAARGQGFVLRGEDYPEAEGWVRELLATAALTRA